MRVLKSFTVAFATTLIILAFAGVATADTGDVIILYKDDITREQAQGVRARAGVRALDKLNTEQRIQLQLVKPGSGLTTEEAARKLKQDPYVLAAIPNAVVRKALPEQDLYIPSGTNDTFPQWGLYSADVFDAWRGKSFSEVSVAVIDTGVQRNHPDLSASTWINPGEIPGDGIDNDGNGYIDDIYGWDWVQEDNDPSDVNGHGTHVAGTIGATINNGIGIAGVAPNVKIASLRTLDGKGEGTFYEIFLALIYAGETGFDIANGSLGGAISDGSFLEQIYTAYPDTLYVFAAGNSGVNNDTASFKFYPCTSDATNVVCVAAVNSNDDLASFSNYGATSVELAAPGVSIISTYPTNTYATSNGTSMASPHVAGVAALALGVNPDIAPHELRDILIDTGYPSSSLSGKTVSGKVLSATQVLGEIIPPVLIGEPGISSGEGSIAASSFGDWSGEVAITEALLEKNNGAGGWQETDFNLVNPEDFAASSYFISEDEEGSAFRLRVEATNGSGSTVARSNIVTFGGVPESMTYPEVSHEGPLDISTLLMADAGGWLYSPSSFDYIWERGISTNGPWNEITDATSVSYMVAEEDRGMHLRVRVVARNYHGVGSATSSSVFIPAVAGNITPPSILPLKVGDVLFDRYLPGEWDVPIESYSISWYRDGELFTEAPDEYVIQASDAGLEFALVETVEYSLPDESCCETSDPLSAEAVRVAPHNTEKPALTRSDNTLTITPGIWLGDEGASLVYQWLRDGAPITGAVGSSYNLQTADYGTTLSVRVIRGHGLSVSDALSNTLSIENLPAPPPPPAPTSPPDTATPPITNTPTDTTSPTATPSTPSTSDNTASGLIINRAGPVTNKKRAVRAGAVPVRMRFTGSGSANLLISLTDSKGKVVGRARIKASGDKNNVTFRVKLNARGVKQLKQRGAFRITMTVTGKNIKTNRSRFTLR